MGVKKDLTGLKFGRLTVLYEVEPRYTSGGNKKIMWHCKCDCDGKELDVSSSDLLSCHTKSCGCLNNEKRHMSKNKKYNTYDLSGEYGIGYDSKGNEFWFDLEDYNLIKDYCWFKHREYFQARQSGNDKHIFLHKLIMNDFENTMDIDHIDTNRKYNNRKSNLRVAKRIENCRNRKLNKNNTSGVTGVYWVSREQKWRATIKVNYKRIELGDFDDFDKAVKARKDAEKIYFKNFSYDESQKLAKQNSIND
jgi:hypothetical protein